MKKAKKLGLQSLALVLMAFVLVAGVAFGMTGAWFTDRTSATPAPINLGNQVKADLTAVAFAAPQNDSAHKVGANGDAQYLPGDTVALSGKVTPDATSTSFYARMKVTILNTTTAEITFTSVTVGDETVTVGDEWVYLETEFIAGVERNITGTITIEGAANPNQKANTTIAVKIEMDMIQSANITVDEAWKNAGTVVSESLIIANTTRA